MKSVLLVICLCVPVVAAASDLGAPLGTSTGGSLYNPAINVIGKTAPTRLTTIKPRGQLNASGPLSVTAESATPGRRTIDADSLLIEQRLDCFAGSPPPDRDERNRFLTRCPGNQ
ncbi:MAG: hypothetical protein ACREEE_03220 [Dongiaceae bacterium]